MGIEMLDKRCLIDLTRTFHIQFNIGKRRVLGGHRGIKGVFRKVLRCTGYTRPGWLVKGSEMRIESGKEVLVKRGRYLYRNLECVHSARTESCIHMTDLTETGTEGKFIRSTD